MNIDSGISVHFCLLLYIYCPTACINQSELFEQGNLPKNNFSKPHWFYLKRVMCGYADCTITSWQYMTDFWHTSRCYIWYFTKDDTVMGYLGCLFFYLKTQWHYMHSIYPTLRPARIYDLNSKYFVLLVVANDFSNIVKWLYNVSMHMQ